MNDLLARPNTADALHHGYSRDLLLLNVIKGLNFNLVTRNCK